MHRTAPHVSPRLAPARSVFQLIPASTIRKWLETAQQTSLSVAVTHKGASTETLFVWAFVETPLTPGNAKPASKGQPSPQSMPTKLRRLCTVAWVARYSTALIVSCRRPTPSHALSARGPSIWQWITPREPLYTHVREIQTFVHRTACVMSMLIWIAPLVQRLSTS